MQLPKEIYRYKNNASYYTSYITEEDGMVQKNLGSDKKLALQKLEELRQELSCENNIPEIKEAKPARVSILKKLSYFFKNSPKLFWILFIIALLTVCIGLRLYGFTSKPLWLDEVVELSYTIPAQSFSTVIKESAAQAQPPLDYLIIWQIRRHIPFELSFRIPHFVYSVLSFICIWLWAKRIFSRPGIIAEFQLFFKAGIRIT